MAWRNGVVLPAHVDWLQSRWIGNSEVDIHSDKWKKAYFVHPRNAVLDKVTPMLQLLEGLTSGETVYIWQSIDMYSLSPTTPITKQDVIALSELHFKKTSSLKLFIWFKGCKMVFTSNKFKQLRWLYMNECEGVDLLLHPDEPEPTTNGRIRVLQYHPKLLVVKPAKCPDTSAVDFGLGAGNVGITVEHVEFNLQRQNGEIVKITRWGFVDLFYAKGRTDYGVQCETIRSPQSFLTDLTKPVGKLAKGSFLVIVSRAESLDTFAIIEPLYRDAVERERYITFLTKHVALTEEKMLELLRIEQATADLKAEFPELLHTAASLGQAPENAISFPTYSQFMSNQTSR